VSGELITYVAVTVAGDARPRLDAVDATIAARGITALVGPSGSGKSTMLRLANRLEAPTSGRVEVRGIDNARLDPLALRRELGMVFQRPVPLPGTVLENLRAGRAELSAADAGSLLDRVGLERSFLERDATRLSGGEGQRVCIARALAVEPRALLLDEPTSALDPAATREIEQLVRGLADDGLPSVWVTHDLEQMERLADAAVLLVEGRVAYSGDAAGLVASGTAPSGFFEEPTA
jgi:putative ABC transport system ATP-binding protein